MKSKLGDKQRLQHILLAIEEIEIIRRAKVRKAKLYYLRTRIGKSTRLKERFN